jgi:hypothetical protein
MTTYIILNLLLLLAVCLDFNFNKGRIFTLNDETDLKQSLIIMSIPIANLYVIYKLVRLRYI